MFEYIKSTYQRTLGYVCEKARDWGHFWLQDFEGGGAGRGRKEGGDPLRQERGLSSATGMPAQWSVFYCAGWGKALSYGGFCWPTLKQACESCDADTGNSHEKARQDSQGKLLTPGLTTHPTAPGFAATAFNLPWR